MRAEGGDADGGVERCEIAVVGGGPGGLSAALMLARCRRRVVVCDAGMPRNASSRALHGFLSRDGIPPRELLATARAQLEAYPDVRLVAGEAVDATAVADGYRLSLADGTVVQARALILATGLRDRLPDIPGLSPCYGVSVFHCPYCDAYEWRDRRIGVLGDGRRLDGLANELLQWSARLVLFPASTDDGSAATAQRWRRRGFAVADAPIAALVHDDGRLRQVRTTDGNAHDCDALFFVPEVQRSPLPERLGCSYTRKGAVQTDRFHCAGAAGLFVVGDADEDPQLAIVAAAEGAVAAVAANRFLGGR